MTNVARRKLNLTRSAARVAIAYAVVSAIWIAASDRVVEWLVTDRAAYTSVQTLKGWFFVAVTALLLYWALKAELARTAQATAKSERYQALAENARDVMLVVRERDGQILEANPAALQAYGCTRSELLGKTVFDLRAGEPVARIQAQMAQAASGGVLFETEHRRANGTTFPVEVSSRGLELEHESVLISVIRDVAERKAAQAEEQRLAAERDRLLARLNLVLDNMPIACLLSDAQARTTYWNRAAERVFGFSGQEMLGKTQFEANIPPSDASLVRETFRQLFAGEVVAPIINKNVTKDGRTIVCEWHNVPLTDQDGTIVGFVGMALDVTERLRAEEEIQALNAELEERVERRTAELLAANARLEQASEALRRLNRLKSEFVALVSHELRTPLANIRLYLSLLEDGRPEKQEHYLTTLDRESALLQSLIEDLLDLSQLDLGQTRARLQPINLAELVGPLALDRRKLLEQRGLELRVDLAGGATVVSADGRLLTQVLSRLLTNAMTYTPAPGRITVSLAIRPDANGRPNAVCAVSDTGPGITEEDRAHLFERFYRGYAAALSRAPGTGLGLAICDEIVRRHGGHIEVESVLGQGSTFAVWLPLLPEG